MLSGSTNQLVHQFTTAASVTPTAASVLVKLPDGSTSVLSLTTPSAGQNPTAGGLLSFIEPGPYALYWQMQTSDGQILLEQDDYFAPYTSVHVRIRERLNATTATLPDAPLDSALCFVSRLMLKRLSTWLTSYAVVPAQDVNTFDQALTLLAAAYLRPLTPKTVASGELTTIQVGTDKWQYSELAARAEKPLDPVERQWLDQSNELVMSCSFVSEDDNQLTAFPLFQLNGNRRYARQQLNKTNCPLYQLWGDHASEWAWERGRTLDWVTY